MNLETFFEFFFEIFYKVHRITQTFYIRNKDLINKLFFINKKFISFWLVAVSKFLYILPAHKDPVDK